MLEKIHDYTLLDMLRKGSFDEVYHLAEYFDKNKYAFEIIPPISTDQRRDWVCHALLACLN